ncbi:MAG: endolytic transglycosylase MltG [Bdellovibrionales bacterium]|nr:endolytic transglycosylase MltG [Bdellovibrionales bacterium]
MFQFLKMFLYIAVPLGVGFGSFQYLKTIFFTPLDVGDAQTKIVTIEENKSLSDVCKLLVAEHIIRKTHSVCLYRQLKGSTEPLVPGEYELSPAMTPAEVLAKLEKGDRFLRTVEIPAGSSVEQVDKLFSDLGFFERYQFDAAARDPKELTRAGIAAESFEGYLGTGTFQFASPLKPSKVLWEMMERSEQSWASQYTEQLDKLRMSRHEVLTLASIIQKATDGPVERRMVSSVLHNRLENGLKLESLEALTYGIRDFDGTIREEDKALPSPYNTFLSYGLPPGPILNPDKDAIEAALFPAESSNLYYGRSQSGKLVFSATPKEHEENLKS